MVFLPVRHGKSHLTSEIFPAWYLAHFPHHHVGIISYTHKLARGFTRAARDRFAGDIGPQLGFEIDPDVRGQAEWRIKDHGGGCYGVGIGGSLTGRGFNCLPAGTMVSTENGSMDIVDIVNSSHPPRVWGYDHAKGREVLNRIVASREGYTGEIISIKTSSGRSISATGDHHIYVDGYGYKPANLLQPGDRVLSKEISSKQNMYPMRSEERGSRTNVQGLLQQEPENKSCIHLHVLRSGISQGESGVPEKYSSWSCGHVLFTQLFPATSRDKKSANLSRLHFGNRNKDFTVLSRMQNEKERSQQSTYNEELSTVHGNISSNINSSAILQSRVCQSGSFRKNERERELSLFRWEKLCTTVPDNASSDIGKRQQQVCGVLTTRLTQNVCSGRGETNEIKFNDTSYQRTTRRQSCGESCNPVFSMSHETSQVKYDTVSVVERVYTGGIPIYDIQIEETNNFFANEILVHNCILIDDPIKNQAEAMSSTVRESVDDFYRGTAYNRLEPDGKLVLIQARYHTDDLAGRLLADVEEGVGDGWTILKLPAIATEDEHIGDWHRKKGEALWPERFDIDALERSKRTSPFWFAALFQQEPIPEEGTMFRREWFDIIPSHPNDLQGEVRYWDLASTEAKQTSDPDYTVGTRYGWSKSLKKWVVVDVIRFRKSPGEVEKTIRQTALIDGRSIPIWIEEEPGSSGKSVTHHYKTNVLKEFTVKSHKPTGKKEIRAMPVSANAESGLMVLVKGEWNREWLNEIEVFPLGAHDDQVDSVSGAHDVVATQMTQYPEKVKPFGMSKESRWKREM